MSEVVTVQSSGSSLNWNSGYTWDSLPSDFTWNSNTLTGYNITVQSSLGITDSGASGSVNKRETTETIPLEDSIKNSITKVLVENLRITDFFVRNSGGVLYDVTVRNNADSYTVDDLGQMARSQVGGYEPGVEFLPGDYDFKEAIIGLVVTNNSQKKIGFKEIDMYTDTPDVIDRGTVTITNSGDNYDPVTGYTTVYLNKEYHTVPNITASVVSGNTLAEPVFDPNGFSTTYFKVKLVLGGGNNSVSGTTLMLNGNPLITTGTLLWKAAGY